MGRRATRARSDLGDDEADEAMCSALDILRHGPDGPYSHDGHQVRGWLAEFRRDTAG
ncbi:hypothetical protein [Micromonospora sp. L31]|uniref:hypothetical protein n=1 Tax=Micromonospora sp. L31 TaxID=3452213 RepID=UPI003F895418